MKAVEKIHLITDTLAVEYTNTDKKNFISLIE